MLVAVCVLAIVAGSLSEIDVLSEEFVRNPSIQQRASLARWVSHSMVVGTPQLQGDSQSFLVVGIPQLQGDSQ